MAQQGIGSSMLEVKHQLTSQHNSTVPSDCKLIQILCLAQVNSKKVCNALHIQDPELLLTLQHKQDTKSLCSEPNENMDDGSRD